MVNHRLVPRTIFQKHEIGLLADDSIFAGAIGKLLADRLLRDKLGRQARHVAETVFGWSYIIERLETFYQQVILNFSQ